MKRSYPNLFIIVIFKALTIPEIIELVREGADDCVPKPLDIALLVSRIRTLLMNRDVDRNSVDRLLAEKRRERYRSSGNVIVPTEEIQHMINLAKDRDIPVLLQGAAGTMKNSYAKYLHQMGNRRPHPFVTFECSGSELLESRLYGYETVSEDNRTLVAGALSMAERGTLLLKDIEYIPMPIQSGLVEVLSEKCFTPLGGRSVIPFSARIVATTKQEIEQLVAEGKFSQELYYAISVVHIIIPPLSQRRDRIPELMSAVLGNLCRDMNFTLPAVGEDCLRQIEEYDWPGNEREFIYRMERSLFLCQGGRFTLSLPRASAEESSAAGADLFLPEDGLDLKTYMHKKEKELLLRVLSKFDGKKNKVAAYLGITERTLRNKLNEMQLEE